MAGRSSKKSRLKCGKKAKRTDERGAKEGKPRSFDETINLIQLMQLAQGSVALVRGYRSGNESTTLLLRRLSAAHVGASQDPAQ